MEFIKTSWRSEKQLIAGESAQHNKNQLTLLNQMDLNGPQTVRKRAFSNAYKIDRKLKKVKASALGR